MRKPIKKCKRKKCPYYNIYTNKCMSCEWNKDAVWKERK